MNNSSLKRVNEDQELVNSDEIQTYQGGLLKFLVNYENGRTTEELKKLREIVSSLSVEIGALRTLGVTYSEIADQLKLTGLVIDGDTLQEMHYEHSEQVTKESIDKMMSSWCDAMISQAKRLNYTKH